MISARRAGLGAAAALAAASALSGAGAVQAAAAAGCKLALLPIPVRMERLRPTVEVKINGAPARLLVDTGAFFSMIPDAAARQYGLKVGGLPQHLEVTGVGGSIVPGVTTIHDLEVGGAPFSNYQFLVGGSDATGGAAGLLGENILHAADVEFDLADGMMRFVRATGCGTNSLAYWAKGEPASVIPMEADGARRGMIMASAFINGRRIRVIFDSGASRSFLTFAAARRAGVSLDAEKAGLGFGIGRRLVEERLGLVESFRIGEEQILHTQIPMADSELPGADMLLGADFFLSHRILVANAEGKIYFTYNGGPVFALHPQTEVAGSAAPAPVPATGSAAPAGPLPASSAARKPSARRARSWPADPRRHGGRRAHGRRRLWPPRFGAPQPPRIRAGHRRLHPRP
ncbi:MAG TPA: aspartyl protease family protein [Caulobacteraceae bacterium]|nr:aspartyl protease family protein [Caulobacteraceae bacterium]